MHGKIVVEPETVGETQGAVTEPETVAKFKVWLLKEPETLAKIMVLAVEKPEPVAEITAWVTAKREIAPEFKVKSSQSLRRSTDLENGESGENSEVLARN